MKEKKMFDAITNVDNKYIEEASKMPLNSKYMKWRRWSSLAASLLLVITIGGILIKGNLLPFGGSSQSGQGYNEDGSFDFYAGPVFPLSLKNTDDEISATRDISFDFSLADDDSIRVWGSDIKDTYNLTNNSSEEKTIKVIYPFVSSFQNIYKNLPSLLINGVKPQARIYAGTDYTNPNHLTNPTNLENRGNGFQISNFDGYKNLLIDNNYKESTFMPDPVLDQQVIVYNFSDFEAPEEYDAATQAISFTINPEVTRVLQYGFNGSEFGERGFRRYSYFVPRNDTIVDNSKKVLIIIGEDIEDYALQGYKNGACEEGNELDGVSVKITRSEENLKDLMALLVEDYYNKYDINYLQEYGLDESFIAENNILKIFEGAVSEFVTKHNLFSLPETDNYSYGMLDDIISLTDSYERIFYLEFEVNIPANSTIEIIANSRKDPSHNFRGNSSAKGNIQGYDMATRLSSNLSFEKLTAQLTNPNNIEILEQNFGFDTAKGITRVDLDLNNEHYYMYVRAIER